MYTIHTTHRKSQHFASAVKAERAAQAADVIRIEKDDTASACGFRIIDQVELARDARDESECRDCGATTHQTGTYHCLAVHQGDSAD